MYPCNTCCSSDIDVFYHFTQLPHSFHTKFYTWICIANNHPNRSSESVKMCNWISANIIIIIEIIDLVSRTSSKYTFCVNSALRTFWFASLDSHIPSISMWTILFIANATNIQHVFYNTIHEFEFGKLLPLHEACYTMRCVLMKI